MHRVTNILIIIEMISEWNDKTLVKQIHLQIPNVKQRVYRCPFIYSLLLT